MVSNTTVLPINAFIPVNCGPVIVYSPFVLLINFPLSSKGFPFKLINGMSFLPPSFMVDSVSISHLNN